MSGGTGPRPAREPWALTLRSADDLTPEVLTAILRRHHHPVTVSAVSVRSTWQGTTSHVHLDVVYAEPTALPERLFVKTQLDTVHGLPDEHDASLSEGGGGTSLLTDETTFYRDVRPGLVVETPAVYVAEHLAGPSQFIIVAEDVAERGARFPDPRDRRPVEEVDRLLRCLARVHAPLWGSARLADDGDLAWLGHPVHGAFADFLRTAGFSIIRALLDVPYKKHLLARAGTDADALEASFWALAEVTARRPITLLHGDPHPGNTYVLPDDGVGVLDWQLVRRGSWAHDLSYALVAALEPDDRREHERALLDGYLEELRAAGVANAPDREHAWLRYRASPVWGFCMWAITPGEMYSDDLVETVLRRFAEAHADLDTRSALEELSRAR